jgi:hypothetical protein
MRALLRYVRRLERDDRYLVESTSIYCIGEPSRAHTSDAG